MCFHNREMTMVRQFSNLLAGLVPLVLLNVSTVSAMAEDLSAYQVVEQATNRVMAVVEEAPTYIDDDPERYFHQLEGALADVVDYSGFSRSVMGPYVSKKRYKSLDTEGKKQMRAQVERFTEVMRNGLVRTYGKGLLAFGGSKIEIQRPDAPPSDERKVAVTQLIYSDAATPYVIEYMMRRGKDGSWRVRNLRVESINLGVIYYNQFQAAAKDAGGDLDYVIDNWTAPPEEAEATEIAESS